MTVLQGTTIPHSYGFYMVMLLWKPSLIYLLHDPQQFSIPSGKEVIGHVMEKIGRLETTIYLQRNANNLDSVWALVSLVIVHIPYHLTWTQADATAWVLHALHWAGVVHYDFHHCNMHVLPTDPLSKSAKIFVILFDFAFASQIITEYGNNLLECDGNECEQFYVHLYWGLTKFSTFVAYLTS